MADIVLAMITYNSVEKLGAKLFRRCLESSLQVPYEAIILVDDSPGDATRRLVAGFADEHGKELVVARNRYEPRTRATARQTAVDVFNESFSEEWLFFLDDDAELRPGWWREAEPHTRDPRVGLVWGINWDVDPVKVGYLRAVGIDYRDYLVRAFRTRGGTHDTLLRRPAIRGLRIPAELHTLEDGYIKWYVECHGWEIRIVETGVIHHNPWRPETIKHNKKYIAESVRVAYKYGIVDGVFSEEFHKEYQGIIRPLLGVLRPIIGTIILLPKARTIGFRTHLRRQAFKLLNRWHLFLARLKYGPPPHPCEAICGRENCDRR